MAAKPSLPVQAATYSFWAPWLAFTVNFLCTVSAVSPPVRAAVGLASMAVYITALVAGVLALLAMKKHGRKGILVRASVGVLLNAAILVFAIHMIPTVAKVREAERRYEALQNIKPFTFVPPAGFRKHKVDIPGVHILQSYVKGDPADNEPDVLLIVEDLGGVIRDEDPSEFVKGKEGVRLLHEKWKTHTVPLFEVREKFGDVEAITYNVQVPLLPSAVQIRVSGLAEREAELRDVVRQSLKRLDGTSNW